MFVIAIFVALSANPAAVALPMTLPSTAPTNLVALSVPDWGTYVSFVLLDLRG